MNRLFGQGEYSMRLITSFAFIAAALFTNANASQNRHEWPTSFWKDFIEISVESGLPKAFGGDRFPLIESLIKLGRAENLETNSLKTWLNGRMREHFFSNKRDQALIFKGFLSCIESGACEHLFKLDPKVNSGAKRFEPDLTVVWKGDGQPAGPIDWSAGKFAYIGRIQVVDEFWDEERGAYIMLLIRSTRNNLSTKPNRYQIELAFYSSCTFTGHEQRGFGIIELGGHCPSREPTK